MTAAYPKTAWQKQVRNRRAQEKSGDLFGSWWDDVNTDIKAAVVRQVSFDTAKAIIEEYEWLGTMPHICLYAYGIFLMARAAVLLLILQNIAKTLEGGISTDSRGKLSFCLAVRVFIGRIHIPAAS